MSKPENDLMLFLEEQHKAQIELIKHKIHYMYKHVSTWKGLRLAIKQRESIIKRLSAKHLSSQEYSAVRNWDYYVTKWNMLITDGERDALFMFGEHHVIPTGNMVINMLLRSI